MGTLVTAFEAYTLCPKTKQADMDSIKKKMEKLASETA